MHKRKTRKNNQNSLKIGSQIFLRYGLPYSKRKDLYHWLLTMPWSIFLGMIGCAYLIINICFAFAYLLGGNGIENARPGSFIDAFSFSVQTMATIGYGAMYPQNFYTHILVTIEVFIGLLGVAMATGLMFARFSRPIAKIMFSKVAVICPYDGIPTLMFRTANKRSNAIVEARIRVTLMRSQVSPEGQVFNRLYDLNLVRSETPNFSLTWTVMHKIDENSPLYGVTPQIFAQEGMELIVMISGLDETVSQTVHSRHDYFSKDIYWNYKLVDILSRNNKYTQIDYGLFHKVEEI